MSDVLKAFGFMLYAFIWMLSVLFLWFVWATWGGFAGMPGNYLSPQGAVLMFCCIAITLAPLAALFSRARNRKKGDA